MLFAKIENGIVTNVEVAEQSHIDRLGGTYIATPRNGTNAGIGFTYDATKDVFIAPKPYPSWVLDSTYTWQAPTAMPTDNNKYYWDEESLKWVKISL